MTFLMMLIFGIVCALVAIKSERIIQQRRQRSLKELSDHWKRQYLDAEFRLRRIEHVRRSPEDFARDHGDRLIAAASVMPRRQPHNPCVWAECHECPDKTLRPPARVWQGFFMEIWNAWVRILRDTRVFFFGQPRPRPVPERVTSGLDYAFRQPKPRPVPETIPGLDYDRIDELEDSFWITHSEEEIIAMVNERPKELISALSR
jgi:hypothetical protein